MGTIAPDEARERCQKVLGNVEHGRHSLHGLGGTDGISLGMFIADNYRVWVNASRPRTAGMAGVRLAAVLNRAFGPENQFASGSEKRGADRQHVRTRLERLTFST